MRTYGKKSDGVSGWLVYLFTLAFLFLIFWIARDLGYVEDYGPVYNTGFTILISISAWVMSSILRRNLKIKGGEKYD